MNIYYPIRRLDNLQNSSEIPKKYYIVVVIEFVPFSPHRLKDISPLNSVLAQFIYALARIQDEIAHCENFALSLYLYANDTQCLVWKITNAKQVR